MNNPVEKKNPGGRALAVILTIALQLALGAYLYQQAQQHEAGSRQDKVEHTTP